jgi:hypothetical protein
MQDQDPTFRPVLEHGYGGSLRDAGLVVDPEAFVFRKFVLKMILREAVFLALVYKIFFFQKNLAKFSSFHKITKRHDLIPLFTGIDRVSQLP